MKQEIEVKFLGISHDDLRAKLQAAEAVCEHPMRLMRRAIIDYPDKRMQTSSDTGWGWVRVRDEGDRVTCTYKHIANDGKDTTHEIEFEVSSYEKACELFEAIGLTKHAEQETKRETWKLDGVEVVLDEWPWLPQYIEIEGESETALQSVAEKLGLKWEDADRGSSDRVYRVYYPKMTDSEGIADIPQLTFGGDLPQWLKDRQ
ncbi:MAG TPA: class IV adenylate cyclase [Candidatus Saccharimonadales bacterium]|nr:class IV adenylate cyclase [Candidatus Saccharimonadales bacterium]